jgi:hypothetical protein
MQQGRHAMRNPAYRLSTSDLADDFDRQAAANQAEAQRDDQAAADELAAGRAYLAVSHERMASFSRGRATAFASAAQQLRDNT